MLNIFEFASQTCESRIQFYKQKGQNESISSREPLQEICRKFPIGNSRTYAFFSPCVFFPGEDLLHRNDPAESNIIYYCIYARITLLIIEI